MKHNITDMTHAQFSDWLTPIVNCPLFESVKDSSLCSPRMQIGRHWKLNCKSFMKAIADWHSS